MSLKDAPQKVQFLDTIKKVASLVPWLQNAEWRENPTDQPSPAQNKSESQSSCIFQEPMNRGKYVYTVLWVKFALGKVPAFLKSHRAEEKSTCVANKQATYHKIQIEDWYIKGLAGCMCVLWLTPNVCHDSIPMCTIAFQWLIELHGFLLKGTFRFWEWYVNFAQEDVQEDAHQWLIATYSFQNQRFRTFSLQKSAHRRVPCASSWRHSIKWFEETIDIWRVLIMAWRRRNVDISIVTISWQ